MVTSAASKARKPSPTKRKKVNGRSTADILKTRAASVKVIKSSMEIPIDCITPFKFNPRSHFDQDAIEKLAQSLNEHGQLQEAIVRPRKPRSKTPLQRANANGSGKQKYELIGGERRWRAAQKSKLNTLRARVVECDDATAVELAGIENYEREQLNAVEEARWFRNMIDEAGYTQTELATRLELSQPTVAQRLALLDVPKDWQDWIIAGVIPASYMRDAMPYFKLPGVMEATGKTVDKEHADGEPFRSVNEFMNVIRFEIGELAHDLDRQRGQYVGNKWVQVKARPTKDELAELDIHEAPDPNDKKTTLRLAFNRKLYEQILDRTLKEAAAGRRNGSSSKAKSNGQAANKPSKADVARKKREQAKQYQARLYRWVTSWRQARMVERIADISDGDVLRFVLFYAHQATGPRTHDALSKATTTLGGKAASREKRGFGYGVDEWAALVSIDVDDVRALAVDLLKQWFAVEPGFTFSCHHTAAQIEDMAAFLDIDIVRDWQLERSFLELHTKDQLQALADEWKHCVTGSKSKMVQQLLMERKGATCPKCIKQLKRPEGV